MWSSCGSKGMVLESKRDPRMCPSVPKWKSPQRPSVKPASRPKKTRELKERCGATPVCTGKVYFGNNFLVWWPIRANPIRILGFLGVLDAKVQFSFPKNVPFFLFCEQVSHTSVHLIPAFNLGFSYVWFGLYGSNCDARLALYGSLS